MKKISIIPARSGSKGLKNKNILELCGIPMFAWSIIHSKYYSNDNDIVVVSSDDDNYLEIARKFGAVGIKRPESLSLDSALTEPVMDHVLSKIQVDTEDIIILLQPTSPVRKMKTLDFFKKNIDFKKYDSALTVVDFHGFLWEDSKKFIKPLYNSRPRRQDMTKKYCETGSIYATKAKNYFETSNRVSGRVAPIYVSFEESLEVDTYEEFKVIESYLLNNNEWNINK